MRHPHEDDRPTGRGPSRPWRTDESCSDVDELLGAVTRRTLANGLSEALGSGAHRLAAVVMCDLDRFRRVNEALGYQAGDELLCVVADRLRSEVGQLGEVARLGGDQFVLAFPDLSSEDDLEEILRRLQRAVRSPAQVGGHLLYPSASFGRASRHSDEQAVPRMRDGSALMWAAEADMRAAKEHRRGRPRIAAPFDLLRLDSDLHLAAERGTILAHFQPIFDVSTGRLTAFETLARWHHETFGFIPPDVFIPLAEDNGLIHEIGDRMLRAAHEFLSEDADTTRRIYVNVSTEQLSVAGFADRVARIFGHDLAQLRRTTIEVTESSLIHDKSRVGQELAALRALGVGVAVDDFGSGYSSLSQLQELPVTELKIDRALVQRDGVVGHAVLEAIMQLARSLGIAVVAEGVERPDQLELLRRLRCQRVQGFLFGQALPIGLALALPAFAGGPACTSGGTPTPSKPWSASDARSGPR